MKKQTSLTRQTSETSASSFPSSDDMQCVDAQMCHYEWLDNVLIGQLPAVNRHFAIPFLLPTHFGKYFPLAIALNQSILIMAF